MKVKLFPAGYLFASLRFSNAAKFLLDSISVFAYIYYIYYIYIYYIYIYYIYILYIYIYIQTKSANNAAYRQVARELPFAGNGLQALKTCAWSCTATKIAGTKCIVEMRCYKCCHVQLKASWPILLHNDSGTTQSLSANCGR